MDRPKQSSRLGGWRYLAGALIHRQVQIYIRVGYSVLIADVFEYDGSNDLRMAYLLI